MRALIVLLALASPALAQDRPSEGDLFGEPPKAEPAPAPPPQGDRARPATPGMTGAREPEEQEGRLLSALGRTDNPLQIGGQLYLRSVLAAREGDAPSRWSFEVPSLLDVYLDARPSERVRAFVLGRMQYDPTLEGATADLLGNPPPQNPRVFLDQLWLRFDVAHTAFVTAGKQHVKWGVGRFWNPTDYLHVVKRNPLDVFDPRTGTTMVKVHVPWERQGWNFYALAILEPLATSAAGALDAANAGATSGVAVPGGAAPASGSPEAQRVGGIGGALRAEVVLGPSEVGLGAVFQRGHRPRFAVDASAGVLELDLYGEAALKTGSEIALYRQRADASAATPLPFRWERYEPEGLTPQVTLGARWAHKYSDEDSLEVGLEYFWNRYGYDDPAVYPALLAQAAFPFFYVGQHYAGAYLFLPKPGSWNLTTVILSTLANLSDRSFVTRLDWQVQVLTYLQVEAYAQAHYGAAAGEFRLAIPSFSIPGLAQPTPALGAQTFDLGLAARVAL